MEYREQREQRESWLRRTNDAPWREKAWKIRIELYGQDEDELYVLVGELRFQYVSQKDICRWLTILLKTPKETQANFLPACLPVRMAVVNGERYQGQFEWKMEASRPGEVIFPPPEEQGGWAVV